MNIPRSHSLIQNGILVFAAQMVVNVCNFLFHFLVSRRIGVVAYGTLNALVSGFQILVVPALIVTTVLVKYASDFHARKEEGRLRALLSRSMLVLGCASAALFVTGALLSGKIAAFFNTSDAFPAVLMVAILCFNLVLPIRGILQGLEHFKPYAVSLILEAVVKVAVAAIFTYAGWGIDGALGAWLLGCAVALVFTWGVQWFPRRNNASMAIALDIRDVFATTGGVTFAMLCVTSLGFSDVVLVKHYFSPASAGLYGAAALAGKMLYFLVYFVPAVLLPRVAANAALGRRTGRLLAAALAIVFTLGGAGTVFFGFFPSLVVQTLAGHAFAGAAPMVFPYAIAATLLAALNTAVTYKIGVGRYDFIAPLAAVAVAQIAAVVLFHASAAQVIAVLTACNAAALALVLLPLSLATFKTSQSAAISSGSTSL